ncbi:MAG: ABC transporter ATP-binding protein [Deltaproteobacteria bacterium]|nr:ABC transporter ATP-binding protein [Deltaproteobacteria bacterium]
MIEVSNLSKSYRDVKAVQNVSFTVGKGEIVGFLGPNGAGKTTTMRMITGALPASSGTVKIAGFDVFESPMEVKKRVGYLPETPPLYQDMTVRDYLTFVARIKGVPGGELKADVERVAKQTHSDVYIHRVIKNLSKGQRQRVGIAQALLGKPEVLVLDEPTVGLDPAQIIEVRELIKSLAGQHTIVLSTHILPEVTAVCQRVLMIAGGTVVADDTLDGLRQKHAGAAAADGTPGPALSLEEIFLKLTSA